MKIFPLRKKQKKKKTKKTKKQKQNFSYLNIVKRGHTRGAYKYTTLIFFNNSLLKKAFLSRVCALFIA